jgi:hypothetical protein
VKENEMEHDNEVSAELHRLATNEHFDPLDTTQLLTRGHRGRRRRTLLTITGTAAGVAAIALAATLGPGLASAGKTTPPVAGQTKAFAVGKKPQNPDFLPVPGVPSGEDAADQRLDQTEALRRCALRNPHEKRPLRKQGHYRSGDDTQYDLQIGQNWAECTVPGGDRPKPALVAAAAADPLPTGIADQLRNCSVQAWIDVTDWRVVATDRSNTLRRSILLAVSPSGHKLVACELSSEKGMPGAKRTSTSFFSLDKLDTGDPVLLPIPKNGYAELFTAAGGSLGGCNNHVCTGYNYVGWGRAAAGASEVRLSIGSSKVTTIPVHDGWFAFTWAMHATFNEKTQPKVVAYDAHGKVVRDFSIN